MTPDDDHPTHDHPTDDLAADLAAALRAASDAHDARHGEPVADADDLDRRLRRRHRARSRLAATAAAAAAIVALAGAGLGARQLLGGRTSDDATVSADRSSGQVAEDAAAPAPAGTDRLPTPPDGESTAGAAPEVDGGQQPATDSTGAGSAGMGADGDVDAVAVLAPAWERQARDLGAPGVAVVTAAFPVGDGVTFFRYDVVVDGRTIRAEVPGEARVDGAAVTFTPETRCGLVATAPGCR